MENSYQGIPGLEQEALDIERRRRIAEAMMAQSQQPEQPFTQAGRYVVPMQFTQGLAQLARALMARKGLNEAKGADESLAQKRQKIINAAMERYSSKAQGAPTSIPLGNVGGGPDIQLPQQYKPDPEGATIELASNPAVPQSAREGAVLQYQAGVRREDKAAERAARAAEGEATRLNRLDIEKMRSQDRADAMAMSDSLRRDLAASQQSFMADQKAQDRLNRMEVAQLNAESRRQAKLDEARGKTDEGKRRVSVNIEALGEYYDELDKMGAAIDTSKGGLANVSASARASKVGQLAGSVFGTEEQSYRNRINQMRPLLLNDIRQATAMGARGLDSNKGLEFYLQAATDPARDLQANRAALQVLENAYGMSSKLSGADDAQVAKLRNEFSGSAPTASSPSAGAPPKGVTPDEWNAMTPEDRALWK